MSLIDEFISTFWFGLFSIPVFVLSIYQIDYLNKVLKHENILDESTRNYSNIVIFNIVIFSISILCALFSSELGTVSTVMTMLILGGILGLNIYNLVVVKSGKDFSRGAVITNLVILYPVCVISFMIIAFAFGPMLFKIFEIFGKN